MRWSRKNGVTLKSIAEPYDTASAAGHMMLQMRGVSVELEHANIVERTKVGRDEEGARAPAGSRRGALRIREGADAA